MDKYYTSEKHTQILIALMKFHGVRKIVASPGATNVCFLGSVQNDPYFEIYSSVDERSAAYIACGLAAESGEPVALTCTGSTASRNYLPGLTEAYYRQLPVLAITATQHPGRVGNYCAQTVDRSEPPKDTVRCSVQLDCVYTEEDEWACQIKANKALIALRKNGGGPAHINLVTTYSKDYSVKELPKVKGISHIEDVHAMPSLEKYKRIAILVGVHSKWSPRLADLVERFCEKYDAVVLKNHASNYHGNYGVAHALLYSMKGYMPTSRQADLVIYIGGVARYSSGMHSAHMWRVNPDGEIRDFEKNTTAVFQMTEEQFFEYYVNAVKEKQAEVVEYAKQWQKEYHDVVTMAPELPFSNVWVAQQLSQKLPAGAIFHMAGSNTARAWNFFELANRNECYSNDGAMGIDGQVSALIGESLAEPSRLHFGAVGDLTFFYDMNSIGNRHVGNNIRLVVVNNGKGAEFRIYTHPANNFGEEADRFMAAAGHFGNRSKDLIRNYAQDLGFEYLFASNKDEFLKQIDRFTTTETLERPILFEVFTDSKDESDAIYAMNHIIQNGSGKAKEAAQNLVRSVAGEEGIAKIKKLLRK